MKLVNMQCPNCGSPLTQEGEQLICHACGGTFTVDYDDSDVEYERIKTEPERDQRKLEHEKQLLEKKYELDQKAWAEYDKRERKRSGKKKAMIISLIICGVVTYMTMCGIIMFVQQKQESNRREQERIEREESERNNTPTPSPTPTPAPNYDLTPADIDPIMDDLIEAGQIAEMDIMSCNVDTNGNLYLAEYNKTGAVFVDAYLVTNIPNPKRLDESNRVVIIYEVTWNNDELGDKTCYDAVYFEGLKIYHGDTKAICDFNPLTIDRSDAAWGWFNAYSYESYKQCYRENITALGGDVTPLRGNDTELPTKGT